MADYTTIDILKRRLDINDSGRDTDLHLAISAASRSIDRDCGREFGPATSGIRIYSTYSKVETTFRPRRNRLNQSHNLFIHDTTSTDDELTLEYANDARGSDGWQTWPTDLITYLTPLNSRMGWPRFELAVDGRWPGYFVRITAEWGWPSVPADIQNAAAILATRLQRRVDSPLGVTGSPEFGTQFVRKIDPDVANLIQGYKRQLEIVVPRVL